MTRFRTCHTCAWPGATCEARATVQAAIAGLGITSLRHRCAHYAPAFEPGDAIKAETLAFYPQDGEDALRCWFPGHFIRLVGQRALVFVPKGAGDLDGKGAEFEPHGNGYLKLPLGRVAHRDAPALDVTACQWCAAILDLGDPCGRDPFYTPARDCLKHKREVAQVPTASPQPTGHCTGGRNHATLGPGMNQNDTAPEAPQVAEKSREHSNPHTEGE